MALPFPHTRSTVPRVRKPEGATVPPPPALLPSLTGLPFLTLGLTLNRKRLAATPTIARLLLLGPIFYGACLGVFGMEHLTLARLHHAGRPVPPLLNLRRRPRNSCFGRTTLASRLVELSDLMLISRVFFS